MREAPLRLEDIQRAYIRLARFESATLPTNDALQHLMITPSTSGPHTATAAPVDLAQIATTALFKILAGGVESPVQNALDRLHMKDGLPHLHVGNVAPPLRVTDPSELERILQPA